MEIHHKVKPLHGWREFFGEVGIIVLGVLVALGAEQVAEQLHWRHLTHIGREAMAGDLADTYGFAIERELYSRCIARRLSDVAAILDQASRTGRLPPVGPLGNPPRRALAPPSWDALVSAQTAAHFGRDEGRAYSYITSFARTADELNTREFGPWSDLYTIVGPGRPYNPAEDTALRRALSEAGYSAKLMRLSAHQIRQMIRSYGLAMDAESLAEVLRDIPKMKEHVATSVICQPIGPPPAHYGASPISYSLEGPIDG